MHVRNGGVERLRSLARAGQPGGGGWDLNPGNLAAEPRLSITCMRNFFFFLLILECLKKSGNYQVRRKEHESLWQTE